MPSPFCNGQGNPTTGDHCCYLGKDESGNQQVCPFLVENDPRDPTRRWSCGAFLWAREQRPNWSDAKIWSVAYGHPQYITTVRAFLDAYGITKDCGDWRGGHKPDGACLGQCCYEGRYWNSAGAEIDRAAWESLYGVIPVPEDPPAEDHDSGDTIL